MADESPIKDIVAVFKKSPALMITGGVVLLVIIVYMYQKSQASAQASTGTTGTTPTGFQPALGTYTYVEHIQQMPGPPPVMTAPTAPPGPTYPVRPIQGPRPGPVSAPTQVPGVTIGLVSSQAAPGGNPFGTLEQVGSTVYQVGPGGGGRLWGVPVPPGSKPLTLSQWNAVPIGSGGKVLLFGST